MNLDTITISLIFAVLGFGIFISFKILNFTDLTVEASFTFGGALSIILCNQNLGILALPISFLGGCLTGFLTGIIHTKLKINSVLSGILTLTAFYTINLLVTRKKPNITLTGSSIYLEQIDSFFNLLISVIIVVVLFLILVLFFKTKLGLSVRACGDNESMISSLNQSVDKLKIIGLMISNGLCALSGCLFVSHQGYFDCSMGNGIMVMGVASMIIGELLIPSKHKVFLMLLSIVIGSFLYRFIYALVIDLNDGDPTYMKLLTTLSILLCIMILQIKERIQKHAKSKKYIRDI